MSILSKGDVKHRCQESVYSNFGHYDCAKNAKYEHEGKWYCGIHNPPTVAAKRKARTDKWKSQMDKDKALRKAKDAVTIAESNVLSIVGDEYYDLSVTLCDAYNELCEARESLKAVNH